MILSAQNTGRPWEPGDDKQLREMAEAGNRVITIALKLKRMVKAVRARPSILRISIDAPKWRNPHTRPAVGHE
jgi:hypothetical protein